MRQVLLSFLLQLIKILSIIRYALCESDTYNDIDTKWFSAVDRRDNI